MPDIDVRRVQGHYEIYVDGKFHSSADDTKELAEELAEIESEERR